MTAKTVLKVQLVVVAGFGSPRVSPEQYPTPSNLATHLARLADLRGDIEGATVLDSGSGIGMLGLGAALRSFVHAIGAELDDDALATTIDDARRVGASALIDWTRTGVTHLPFCLPNDRQITMLTNPPFDAQRGDKYADRAFLDSVVSVADVSYSIHNEGSKGLAELFVAGAGGDLTDALRAVFGPDRQSDFHDEGHRQLDAEVSCIEQRAGGCAADHSPHEPPADTA